MSTPSPPSSPPSAQRGDAGAILLGLGALLLFISLFLHWYQPGRSAWAVFEVWDLVLAGLALAARPRGARPTRDRARAQRALDDRAERGRVRDRRVLAAEPSPRRRRGGADDRDLARPRRLDRHDRRSRHLDGADLARHRDVGALARRPLGPGRGRRAKRAGSPAPTRRRQTPRRRRDRAAERRCRVAILAPVPHPARPIVAPVLHAARSSRRDRQPPTRARPAAPESPLFPTEREEPEPPRSIPPRGVSDPAEEPTQAHTQADSTHEEDEPSDPRPPA